MAKLTWSINCSSSFLEVQFPDIIAWGVSGGGAAWGGGGGGPAVRGGRPQRGGPPPTRCTGRLRFFVWKQPFRSGRIAGIRAAPPLLGGEGGPGFLLRVRGFVLPNRRSPDGGCAARHLVRMLLCIPIPTMFRGGGSTCCAMPAGKPHSATECRSPKFVQFRRRWTLSSSERPLKYIKGYLG